MYAFVLFFSFTHQFQFPESLISYNSSQGTATIGHSRETTSQSESFGSGGDCPLYSPNVYAPQAQAFYYRGRSLFPPLYM